MINMRKRRIFVTILDNKIIINNDTKYINSRYLNSINDMLHSVLSNDIFTCEFFRQHLYDTFDDVQKTKDKIKELQKTYPELYIYVPENSMETPYIDVPDNSEIIKQTYLDIGLPIEIEDNKVYEKLIKAFQTEDIFENDTEQLYKNLREYLVKLNKKAYALEMKKLTLDEEISKMSTESKAIETLLRTVDRYTIK